jgi:hypothetical protein
MRNGKPHELKIRIQPATEKQGFYLAYFTSDFLNATYSVYFQDTITGAVALHDFSEMVRIKYKANTIILEPHEEIFCQNEAVIDVINMSRDFMNLPVN